MYVLSSSLSKLNRGVTFLFKYPCKPIYKWHNSLWKICSTIHIMTMFKIPAIPRILDSLTQFLLVVTENILDYFNPSDLYCTVYY